MYYVKLLIVEHNVMNNYHTVILEFNFSYLFALIKFDGFPSGAFSNLMYLCIFPFTVSGLFVRRMVLAFDKLAFSQVIKLHSKYKSFYDTWAQAQQKNNDDGLYNTSDLDIPLSLMDFAGPSLGQNRVRFGKNQINSTQYVPLLKII